MECPGTDRYPESPEYEKFLLNTVNNDYSIIHIIFWRLKQVRQKRSARDEKKDII